MADNWEHWGIVLMTGATSSWSYGCSGNNKESVVQVRAQVHDYGSMRETIWNMRNWGRGVQGRSPRFETEPTGWKWEA